MKSFLNVNFFPSTCPFEGTMFEKNVILYVSFMKNSATLKKLQFVFRFYSPICKHRFQKNIIYISYFTEKDTHVNAILFKICIQQQLLQFSILAYNINTRRYFYLSGASGRNVIVFTCPEMQNFIADISAHIASRV